MYGPKEMRVSEHLHKSADKLSRYRRKADYSKNLVELLGALTSVMAFTSFYCHFAFDVPAEIPKRLNVISQELQKELVRIGKSLPHEPKSR